MELKASGQETVDSISEKIDSLKEKVEGLGESGGPSFESLAKGFAVVDAAAAGAAAVALKFAADFQDAATNLANATQLPEEKAGEMADAVEGLSDHVAFGGTSLVNALSNVAGQWQTYTGEALTAESATALTQQAAQLAQATHSDLNTTMQGLVQTMIAYHEPAQNAAQVSDILYNTARDSGTSVGELSQAMDRLQGRLGNVAPSLTDVSTLVLELAQEGVTGSRGVMLVSTAFQTLVGKSPQVSAELQKLGISIYDNNGKFVGMQNVIEQLQPVLAGMTDQQKNLALQTIFGTSAAGVMAQVIQGGAAAWDKYQSAVTQSGTVQEAYNNTQKDVTVQLEELKNRVENAARAFGTDLLENMMAVANTVGPPLEQVFGAIHDVIGFLPSDLTNVAGGLVGLAAVGIPAVFFAQKFADLTGALIENLPSLTGFLFTHTDAVAAEATTESAAAEATEAETGALEAETAAAEANTVAMTEAATAAAAEGEASAAAAETTDAAAGGMAEADAAAGGLALSTGGVAVAIAGLGLVADSVLQKTTGKGILGWIMGSGGDTSKQEIQAVTTQYQNLVSTGVDPATAAIDQLHASEAALAQAQASYNAEVAKQGATLAIGTQAWGNEQQAEQKVKETVTALAGQINDLMAKEHGSTTAVMALVQVHDSLTGSLQRSFDKATNFDAAMAAQGQSLTDLNDRTGNANSTVQEYANRQQDAASATTNATGTLDSYVQAVESAKDPVSTLASDIKGLGTALNDNNPQLISAQAESAELGVQIDALKAQTGGLTAAQQEELTSLQNQKKAIDNNITAQQDMGNALVPIINNIKLLTGNSTEAGAKIAGFTQMLQDDHTPAAQIYQDIVNVNTSLNETDASKALAQLETLKGQLTGPEWAAAASVVGPHIIDEIASSVADPATQQALLDKANALGLNVGQQVDQGVTSGMASLTSSINAEGAALMDNLVAQMQTTIQSHSPSRVTADKVGVPIVQGVVAGIQSEAPTLAAAMSDTLTAAVPAMSAAAVVAGAAVGQSFADAITNSAASGAPAALAGTAYQATGGIVTKPTLAMIGEAGPEAVVPLPAIPSGLTTGQTTDFATLISRVTSNSLDATNAARLFADELGVVSAKLSTADQQRLGGVFADQVTAVNMGWINAAQGAIDFARSLVIFGDATGTAAGASVKGATDIANAGIGMAGTFANIVASLKATNISGTQLEAQIDANALAAAKAYVLAGGTLQNIQGNGTINPFVNPDGSANYAAIYAQPPNVPLSYGGIFSNPNQTSSVILPVSQGPQSPHTPTVVNMYFSGPTTPKELLAAMDEWAAHQIGYGAVQHGVV